MLNYVDLIKHMLAHATNIRLFFLLPLEPGYEVTLLPAHIAD